MLLPGWGVWHLAPRGLCGKRIMTTAWSVGFPGQGAKREEVAIGYFPGQVDTWSVICSRPGLARHSTAGGEWPL